MALHNDKWDEFRFILREFKDKYGIESEDYWAMLYKVEEYGYASELAGLKTKNVDERRFIVEGNLKDRTRTNR